MSRVETRASSAGMAKSTRRQLAIKQERTGRTLTTESRASSSKPPPNKRRKTSVTRTPQPAETTRSGRRLVRTVKSRDLNTSQQSLARTGSDDSLKEVTRLLDEGLKVVNGRTRRNTSAGPSKLTRTQSMHSIASASTKVASQSQTRDEPKRPVKRKRSRMETDDLEIAQQRIQELEAALKRALADSTSADEVRKSRDAIISEMDSKILRLTQEKVSNKSEKIQELLIHLDNHFTCALCCDTLAHPLVVTTTDCGHTFCALCILRWYFSKVHRDCGFWHASVDCPMCRKHMVYPPDETPRSILTFPFTTNRLGDELLSETIMQLGKLVEEMESTGKGKTKHIDGYDEMPEGALVWRKNGEARKEWDSRTRRGRSEMQHILRNWSNFTPNDFVALKDKYGV